MKIFRYQAAKIIIPLLIVAGIFLFVALSGGSNPPGKDNVKVERIPDPEAQGENYSLQIADIPQTFEERRLAPAAALLPTRAGYPEASPASISDSERKDILLATEQFMKEWETFRPGDLESGKYQKQIRSLAYPASLDRLSGREDASDPPGVGAQGSARLESRWLSVPGFSRSAFVIDWTPVEAYLVLYGAVRYSGNLPTEGGVKEKAYGVLLRKVGGRWLVERASSEPIR